MFAQCFQIFGISNWQHFATFWITCEIRTNFGHSTSCTVRFQYLYFRHISAFSTCTRRMVFSLLICHYCVLIFIVFIFVFFISDFQVPTQKLVKFQRKIAMSIAKVYRLFLKSAEIFTKIRDEILLNFSGRRGAKECKSCRSFFSLGFCLVFPSGFLFDGFQRCKGMHIL